MVNVFKPTEEEWNMGVVGIEDMYGNKVLFNSIVMLLGQEYGIYLLVCNDDDEYGAALTDDTTCQDKKSRIHFNEFLDYEHIKVVGTYDKDNKVLMGKIGKTEKCISWQSKKRRNKNMKVSA